jgi:hypothetical protein
MSHRTTPEDPTDPLLHHVVDKITNLFETNGTDSAFARKAALSAIAAYHPESRADIVSIARILAFSMASLVALGLAAGTDLTPAQKMRYFGRANALNRSADQTERMMLQRRRNERANPPAEPPAKLDPLPAAAPINHDAALEALVDEAMAAYRATTAQKQAPKSTPAPRPETAIQAAAPSPRPATAYRRSLLNGSAMPPLPPRPPLPNIHSSP